MRYGGKKIQKTDKNTENEDIRISMFTKGMNLYVENLNFFVKTTYVKIHLGFVLIRYDKTCRLGNDCLERLCYIHGSLETGDTACHVGPPASIRRQRKGETVGKCFYCGFRGND